MDDSSTSPSTIDALLPYTSIPIPPQLKFLMNNIKTLFSKPVTSDNYPLWRSQIEKIFAANSFKGFLDGSLKCPVLVTDTSNTDRGSPSEVWLLLDHNIASALLSIISTSILPYVLSLIHCVDIWSTLAHRLQASTRSRIIQLKNELYHLSKVTNP
ncbi:hypothetical protein MA16_Dca015631 [Dendrobium catenatum]|uniref:Retrovirus-related Pol polyprotein from transposon TNT 1-94 n=1 Tax=Dendrobium catenatum TaxID=906689 RepID=A0A2I0WJC0_9ASPA|nr:hypothetical protein MA16_Dca015631 [Dendrobium catenatum]